MRGAFAKPLSNSAVVCRTLPNSAELCRTLSKVSKRRTALLQQTRFKLPLPFSAV